MSRVSAAVKAELNRETAGVAERFCRTCDTWKVLTDFVWFASYYSYRCKACELVHLQKNWAKKGERKPRHDLNYVPFGDNSVHVYGLMVFATAPTPEQLLERACRQ